MPPKIFRAADLAFSLGLYRAEGLGFVAALEFGGGEGIEFRLSVSDSAL